MALDMQKWNRIQSDARSGKWGDFNELRRALCDRHSDEHPDDGISSSDVNHMVYGLFAGNEDMTPEDALYAARYG
jgi:hypothetical protein